MRRLISSSRTVEVTRIGRKELPFSKCPMILMLYHANAGGGARFKFH
jgi:hypothetical protein